MKIIKKGRNKADLLNSLEKIKEDFKNKIKEYDINISKIEDGFNVKAEKSIIFVKFWVDADIVAGDEYYEVTWKTNAPENKVAAAMDNVKDVLEKV